MAQACNGRTVRSSYDAAGHRVRRVTPSGAETRWDYDPAGRPAGLQAGGQEVRFGYDQAGRETVRDLPGGLTLSQEWDPAGRLASQAITAQAGPPPGSALSEPGQMLQRRSYSYRPTGCWSAWMTCFPGRAASVSTRPAGSPG
jgi:YD repeat-containing protein